MPLYVSFVDITEDEQVVVVGSASATNVSAGLVPVQYVIEPNDGIYDFELV